MGICLLKAQEIYIAFWFFEPRGLRATLKCRGAVITLANVKCAIPVREVVRLQAFRYYYTRPLSISDRIHEAGR